MVTELLQNNSSQFTHIVGSQYSGKTHLLKAWVHSAVSLGKTAIYIDGNDNILVLRDLATKFDCIAVDNIELLNASGQIELFDLFNSIKLNNRDNFLLTCSSINLEPMTNFREDLKTRILSGVNLNLKALNDSDLHKAMDIFTTQEGITIAEAEKNYLINHYTRSIGALVKAIKLIAEAAVLEKRNITIPLIKQVLSK